MVLLGPTKSCGGMGNPALTINPAAHLSKKQGCRRIQSIKGEMSCCCVALAQCNTCYLARKGTQPYLQSDRAKGVSEAEQGPAPPLQQSLSLGQGQWTGTLPLLPSESSGALWPSWMSGSGFLLG